jgi:two-component system response regulator FixJ
MQERMIHIVDDEESVRSSIGFLLRAERFAVTAYASGVEFLKAAGDAVPGCILLDIRMPGMDGLEVQAELNARKMLMPLIVLTGHGDVGVAVAAMKAGAVDFIEKPFEKETLIQAIDIAFHRLDANVEAHNYVEDARRRIAALTPREQEVLRGLVRGHPNKTIAYDLGISPRTIEIYRANLMTKLAVRSLSAALRVAFAAGLHEPAA